MKHGVFTTLLNPSNSHCNDAIRISPETKIEIQFKWKKNWRRFSGTENAFSLSTSCVLAEQWMPLHIVTTWHAFDEPFKTKRGKCCQAAYACSTKKRGPNPRTSHDASGKIQVGYIESSAEESGPWAQDFNLFFHLKKHLAGKHFVDDDEVQEKVMTCFKGLAAKFYASGIQKLVPRLNKNLENDGLCVEK